jgi:Family of unknown function (DUF5990)
VFVNLDTTTGITIAHTRIAARPPSRSTRPSSRDDEGVPIASLVCTLVRVPAATAGETEARWEKWEAGGVQIRIEGSNLPGRSCTASPDFPGYDNVHVGIQRRNRREELLGLTPGDARSAVWTLDCDDVATASGVDVRGPYIQGEPHARFIYLSWGTIDEAGVFHMFRRAKLWLDAIPADVMEQTRHSGVLIGRLGLTDAKGHPLCGAVRPPLVEWSAG